MPPQIHVRPATSDDAETIHRFVSELAEFEREPDAVEVTPDVLRAQIGGPSPPFECLLAEIDGEPAGFALFFQNYSTWRGRTGIYLEDIYVSPRWRRSGVARALFRRLAEVAVERRAGRLEFSVLDWNEGAHEFYREVGATPLGQWTTWRLTDRDLASYLNGGGC